jgi:hypothetical protein
MSLRRRGGKKSLNFSRPKKKIVDVVGGERDDAEEEEV